MTKLTQYGAFSGHTVYAHIFPNGKMYIGVTEQKYISQRFGRGKGYYKQPLMNNAINKYGWDSLKTEVIASGLTKDEAYKFEKLLITSLNTNNYEFGYNLADGGNKCNKKDVKRVICTTTGEIFLSAIQASEKMKIMDYRYVYNVCLGRSRYVTNSNGDKLHFLYYEDGKDYPKEDYAHYIVKIAPNKGKKMNFENRDFNGEKNPRARRILCVTTGEIFNTLIDAGKHYSISPQSIGKVAKGKRHHAGKHGGVKLKWEYMED